jgi:hypothetical protein
MESNWAAEHLQVIRTLMERSALYRRALGPIMLYNGCLGLLAALCGWSLHLASPRLFIGYWTLVALLGLTGSLLLARRQALRDNEPFWSPPTRRVTQALMPPIAAGFALAVLVVCDPNQRFSQDPTVASVWLPSAWVVLYGCALHAAGFFMPRGMKLFGWIFLLGGCGLLALAALAVLPSPVHGHLIMGVFFGLLHLIYGVYLYASQERREVL